MISGGGGGGGGAHLLHSPSRPAPFPQMSFHGGTSGGIALAFCQGYNLG